MDGDGCPVFLPSDSALTHTLKSHNFSPFPPHINRGSSFHSIYKEYYFLPEDDPPFHPSFSCYTNQTSPTFSTPTHSLRYSSDSITNSMTRSIRLQESPVKQPFAENDFIRHSEYWRRRLVARELTTALRSPQLQ